MENRPSLCSDAVRALSRGWEAEPPEAILLVDRPAIVDVFLESAAPRLAVVSVDGSPAAVVDWLKAWFRAGHRAPVLYVHDAATIVYPFVIEPIATLVEAQEGEPIAYLDLGLSPLGTSARRFRDPSLPRNEPIVRLDAIPPATLVRYCSEAARRMVSAQAVRSLVTDHADPRRAP